MTDAARSCPPVAGHRQSGQALIVLLAGCLLMFAAVAVFAQYGTAMVARGRLQRGADLAATAAAVRMSADYSRRFEPPLLYGGAPNPAYLSRAEFMARASAAARRSARLNGQLLKPGQIRFGGGVAPDRVSVALARSHRVAVPADEGSGGGEVLVRAAATARLAFSVGSMPGAAPATASGGGYNGPLAYRQGKAMRPDVAAAFDRMFAAARAAGLTLTIASAFRSDSEQARLFAQRPDPKWVAPPGTSLHRYATELDLGPPAAYTWLARNAGRFGFIKRYAWEPWHFGFGKNPRDVPAQYERGSWEPPHGRFDGDGGDLPGYVPARYRPMIAGAAQRWNVQPELLAAQLQMESGFDPDIVSTAGAQGIAQFMPATARSVGLRDPFDPRQAIDAQAQLMGGLLRRFGSVAKALAAYNAGPGAVERYGGVPPYAETQAYVARILSLLKGGGSALGDPAFAGIAVTPRVEMVR